jgi:uncharacterized membrane protein/Mg-chelatase subunit ChlD
MDSRILLIAGAVWLGVLLLDLLLSVRGTTSERRRELLRRLRPLGNMAVAVALFVVGGMVLSSGWSWAAFATGLAALFGLLAALLLAGYWSGYAALGASALAVVGTGGLWLQPAQRGAEKLGRMLSSLTLLQPLWLLLLLCIPALFFLARRNLGLKVRQVTWLWLAVMPGVLLRPVVGLRSLGRLTGLAESWRPWLSLALRTALFALLALALAEPLMTRAGDRMTLMFVIDRSASIPEEGSPDLRLRRMRSFVMKAVAERGAKHDHDSVGVIYFGRTPRLELAPSDVPDLAGFNIDRPLIDETATDIAAALEQAISSFLPDTNKRIVLLSDGNENLGRAEDVARKARAKGVEIDVVPLGAGQRNEEEVLIDSIHTERLAKQGGKVEVNVQIRSFNPKMVLARLTLTEASDNEAEKKPGEGGKRYVTYLPLYRGLNPFVKEQALTDEQRSYSFKAEIEPLCVVEKDDQERVLRLLRERDPKTRWEKAVGVANPNKDWVRIVEQGKPENVIVEGRVPHDRAQNNQAAAHVIARGRRRVLILEDRPRGAEEMVIHKTLQEELEKPDPEFGRPGQKQFEVEVRPVSVLNRENRALLAAFLSNYDCVILANVPCDAVSEEQQEELRKNTHDQGCGLIMIGGDNGYGAGGWQNTAVEKALPVDSDIKSLKVEGKGGLVLIMHACEMAQGNMWEKKIAKLALERLGPGDQMGIIEFGGGAFNFNWVVELQPVGPNRAKILAAIDRMIPGDMPHVDPALDMAHKALTDEARGISAKKVIFITDGDPQQTDQTLLPKLKKSGVTVSTVIVVGHGQPADEQRMNNIAKSTGGQFYLVKDANKLPAIYIKESRMVSQAFVHEKRFPPIVTSRAGPTKRLPDPVPDLKGFVRTTPKPVKNVVVPVRTPRIDGQEFPVLAYWDYGLGKAAAFTSDADRPKKWSEEWVKGGMYGKFWKQVVEWCVRPTESDRVKMKTIVRDGRIIVRLEAEDDEKQPDARLQVQGRFNVTAGAAGGAEGDKRRELHFVQREAGVYEAEVRADDAGTYFITALATRKVREGGKEVERTEVVRGAETMPLAPEYTVLRCNKPLLDRIAAMTNGKVYDDEDQALLDAAAHPDSALFRPFQKSVEARLPLWYWLLFAGGFVLLTDVATRRIAVDTRKVKAWFVRAWLRLRGQIVPEPEREVYFDRLQARKAQPGRVQDPTRAARRFEAGTLTAGPVPTVWDAGAPQIGAPAQPAAPEPEKPAESPEEVMSRLARAKKRIMDERKKDK